MKSLVSILFGEATCSTATACINGLRFDNVSMDRAIDQIADAVGSPGLTRIAFINADCVNIAWRDSNYRQTLDHVDQLYADGIGIRIGARIQGVAVRENVNGTDMFPLLCKRLAQQGTRVFLLGGRPGVAERVRDWATQQAPGMNICGCHHGYFSADQKDAVLEQIDASDAELVLVAFGAPRQDQWIKNELGGTRVRVAIGVGGLFDFYSGRIPRAPLWMRRWGLEWTYRLYQEPGRLWKRYVLGNVLFLVRALAYRWKNRREDRVFASLQPIEVTES